MNRFRKALLHTSTDNMVMLYANGLITRKEVRQQILDRKKWVIDLDRKRDRESDAYEALEEAAREMLSDLAHAPMTRIPRPSIPVIENLVGALKVLSDLREND